MQMSKAIKNIPWQTFEGNDRQQFLVTGKWHIENHERLLVLDFTANHDYCSWQQEGKVDFRIVISKKQRDFAVLFRDKTKVVKKHLRDVKYLYPSSCYMNIDQRTEDMIHSVTGQVSRNHQMETLDAWMGDIIDERRKTARAAAGELPDNAVDACPTELPHGLTDWICREVLANDRTIIYKKGGMRGTCALCGRTVRTSQNNKMAQHKYINCPDCGEEVLCVLSGGDSWKTDYVQNIMAIQRGEDGIVWFRQWHVARDESARYEGGIEKYLIEIARYGIRGRKVGMWVKEGKDHNYMGRCFTYPLDRWQRSKQLYTYDGAYVFYPGGIDETVAGTILQYADLQGYHNSNINNRDVMKYAADFARYPVMEFFWKAGYRNIVAEKVNGISKDYANAVLWKREKLEECIKFPLRMLKALPPEQWDMERMWRMQNLCKRTDLTVGERELLFHSGVSEDNLESITKYAPVPKILKYLHKQRRAESMSDVAQTYRDYLAECEQLNFDLTDKAILFPKNLAAAHERTMQMVDYQNNPELYEKYEKAVAKLKKFTLEQDNLIIRPALTPSELKYEGQALGHCVGGYAKYVADGTSALFLVRLSTNPDTPYYTLELKNKRVTQCRTKNNKSYETDPTVKVFVETWLAQVVAKGGRRQRKQRASV